MSCFARNNIGGTHVCALGTKQCTRHAGPHPVCHNCASHIVHLPFIAAAVLNVRAITPRGVAPPRAANWPPQVHQSPWPGFMTRLCRYCEARELKLRYARERRKTPPGYEAGAHLTAPEKLLMRNPPRRMCTCYKRLVHQNRDPSENGYRHCVTHRREAWHEMILRKEDNASSSTLRPLFSQ